MELSCSDRWTASKADRWTASEADLDGLLLHFITNGGCGSTVNHVNRVLHLQKSM